jgi:hypothetical protein
VTILVNESGQLAGSRSAVSRKTQSRCLFRREGEYWSIAYEGDAFRLRHSKGLGYLAELFSRPGTDLHALTLAAGASGPACLARVTNGRAAAGEGLTSSGVGDAGELLDDQAKDAYRRRIQELNEELHEAERFGDLERISRARAETEFLSTELVAALGLGGRSRRSPGPAERARQSVTKAIKAALSRIEQHSPALGRHLAATVRTGATCTYQPDPRVPIEWEL